MRAAGSTLGVMLYGLVMGALFGALTHAAQGRRRDLAPAAGHQAKEYELQVEEPAADDAERLLAASPAGGATSSRAR